MAVIFSGFDSDVRYERNIMDQANNQKGERVFKNTSFLKALQKRDSILIADQFRYGFTLDSISESTVLNFPDTKKIFNDSTSTVHLLSPWRVDTLRRYKHKNQQFFDIKADLLITSFSEGKHQLPQLYLEKLDTSGRIDSIFFSSGDFEVKTIPIDTTSFQLHDIKKQINYPVTFSEVISKTTIPLTILGIIAVVFFLIRRFVKKKKQVIHKEPAHIVALRELDKYRGDKYWEGQKQKQFYSGVSDALRVYIASRYEIEAMEMTSSEILEALKKKDLSIELYKELEILFLRADYVKFAKHIATNEENATVLPFAIKFVTTTYQCELDKEILGKR